VIKFFIYNLIIIFVLISCNKKENISVNKVSEKIVLNREWKGDPLISDSIFVNSINKTCRLNTPFFERSDKRIKDDNLKCTLSKIKFDYERLNSLKVKTSIGNINSNTEIFIKATRPKNAENADIYNEATLYVEANKKVTDSIIIYYSINFSEALTVKERHYYIDKDNIYLLDIVEDESGAAVEKWSKYRVNLNGEITLVNDKKYNVQNTSKKENINLKGEYYSELNDMSISLDFSSADSVIYKEIGNMGRSYNEFLLNVEKQDGKKIFLTYKETINGFTGNANAKNIFGIVEQEKGKIFFESAYLKSKYNTEKVEIQK
jgi:hypothetical protein